MVQTKSWKQLRARSHKNEPRKSPQVKKNTHPSNAPQTIGSLVALAATLAKSNASWTAWQSPASMLSHTEKQQLLVVSIQQPTARCKQDVNHNKRNSASNYAAMVDWRNYRGGNHVSPVRQQAWPNSATSYAIIALLESMISIERGKPLRLAVADLHLTIGLDSDGEGKEKKWPDQLLSEVQQRGVVDDQDCVCITDRDIHAVRITTQHELLDIAARKHHLTHIGPCLGILQVYDDFFSYGEGVYQHVSGELFGLHCVLIIGYSDFEQCWLCQNTWGAGWGQGGYFKIAYGQCRLDTTYSFWSTSEVRLPTDRVIGDIRSKYFDLEGERGFLGYPITGEVKTSDGQGRFTHFQSGSIFSTASTGAHAVYGAIRDKWAAMGWERSTLGYPITDMLIVPDGNGQLCHFQNGSIYSSTITGACAIHGPIRDEWAAMGWERSALGYPITDVLPSPEGQGQFCHFQNGSIFWSSQTSARAVQGRIREKWATTGWEQGHLGYPIGDETETPDGTGCFMHFQRGSIYSKPTVGTHCMGDGPIRDEWARLGREQGFLGYPISDIYTSDGPPRHICDFEGGSIVVGDRLEVIRR